MKNCVIVIPAYNPDDKFISFLSQLKENDYKDIIVVNDGSKKECDHLFDIAKKEYGCHVVTHEKNKGYGRALKTGNETFLELYGNNKDYVGLIHCDCDGQHSIKDVNNFAELLNKNDSKLIVGERSFNEDDIPLRSRLGNKLTAIIFKVLLGININDTQCGLRGFPSEIVSKTLDIEGDGFEYTTELLIKAHKKKIDILTVPIETIYLNNNETSHFNPLKDSIRIYSTIFKFTLTSLSASVIDLTAFTILLKLTNGNVLLSTYIARVLSCTYVFFMNRNVTFKADKKHTQIIKFITLCIVQGSLSAFLTKTLIKRIELYPTFVKMLVDVTLFFVSYLVQKKIVFKK